MIAPDSNIEAFLKALPPSDLHPSALAILNAAASDPRPWCIGFSGGADSLAAVLLARSMRPGGVVALHFNHCLRDQASDDDETFCRRVCEQLGVPLRVAAWRDRPSEPNEAQARDARHAFFAREMEALGAAILWTGHHLDDVTETMLMRLARGSGTGGLAAPRPVRAAGDGRIVIRPLLSVRKTKIVASLQAANLSWREDATNATGGYLRNRIRHDVIPAWVGACERDAAAGAALSRQLLEEDDVALEAWLDELLADTSMDQVRLDLSALRGRPRALVRRALRRWSSTADVSSGAFEQIVQSAGGEGVVSIAAGWIRINSWTFTFDAPPLDAPEAWAGGRLCEGVTLYLPDGARVSVERVEFTDQLRGEVLMGRVDPSRQAFLGDFYPSLTARPWRPGDRFQPLGAPGSCKLQDLFVNRKVPVRQRISLPVVCAPDDSVVWIPGFPPSENSKVSPDSVMGVQLTYRPGTSTVAS